MNKVPLSHMMPQFFKPIFFHSFALTNALHQLRSSYYRHKVIENILFIVNHQKPFQLVSCNTK